MDATSWFNIPLRTDLSLISALLTAECWTPPEGLNAVNAAHHDLARGGGAEQEVLLDGVLQDDGVHRGGLDRHHLLPSHHQVSLLISHQFTSSHGPLLLLCLLGSGGSVGSGGAAFVIRKGFLQFPVYNANI